ncbi:MAG: cupin domain-containing protein [Chloroflexota bacterium]
MCGYSVNVGRVKADKYIFCQVIFTGPHSQLVRMALKSGEDIGLETYPDTHQFIQVEAGKGHAIIDGWEMALRDGTPIMIFAGETHNLTNSARKAVLRLYIIYTPPPYPADTVYPTRQEAETYRKQTKGLFVTG